MCRHTNHLPWIRVESNVATGNVTCPLLNKRVSFDSYHSISPLCLTRLHSDAGNDAHAGFMVYTRLEELMQVMAITPNTEYYTFACIRGSLRNPSGAPWFPHNPNYDPGPLPPPRVREQKRKEKRPSTGNVPADAQPQGSQPMVAGSSVQSAMPVPRPYNERLPNRPAFRKRRRPQQSQAQAPNQSLPQFSPHHPPQSMTTIDRA